MIQTHILWRWLECKGHEAARLTGDADGWRLDGSAVFSHEGFTARLIYEIECDEQWRTKHAFVGGLLNEQEIEVDIEVHGGRWLINGERARAVEGCVDIDLNFSPSTNLLPIRRLGIAPGARHEVRAAWLRYPSFELDPIEQTYERLDERTIRYTSDGGSFSRDLVVNEHGLVVEYPGLWLAV